MVTMLVEKLPVVVPIIPTHSGREHVIDFYTTLRRKVQSTPFRGVHKKYLFGYVAIHEFSVNQKLVSPAFVSALVRSH